MASKTSKRKTIGMVCEETGQRIYYTRKNVQNTPDKLQLKKYNPIVRRRTLFVETTKNLGRNVVKAKKR